jgi:hypothetical protein
MPFDKTAAAEQLTPVAAPEPESRANGVSEFLGGVLSQLSISSWLPAVMLVGEGAVLLQMRALNTGNPGMAIGQLAEMSLGAVVVVLFALVLGTMVTQAFEFEAIRVLEGYIDVRLRLVQLLVDNRIRRHGRKRKWLQDLHESCRSEAFRLAKAQMAEDGFPAGMIAAIESKAMSVPIAVEVTEAERAAADGFNWHTLVPADLLYKLSSLDTRLGYYPEEHRLLPTRLGNVLRATEDKVSVDDGGLEGFVIRHHDDLPSMVRDTHRDYRTRLDMYCSLTLVFGLLTGFSPLALWGATPVWAMLIALTANAFMMIVAYEAAVASARGYAVALLEVDRVANPDRYQ